MRTSATPTRLSARTLQARREVGRTEVSRPVARLLLALAGLAVLAPPVVQVALDLGAGKGPLPAFGSPGELARDFLRSNGAAVEERLEEASWLRRHVLPPTQRFLTGALGLGNERALAGADGWWYLADDFAHVTGRGFLEPAAIERRFIEDDAVADPVPRLVALAAELEGYAVELVVLPVPAKPTVVPGPLARRQVPPPVHNASFPRLLERLDAAGVAVLDPTPDLLALEADGVPSFLRTDTHWSPAAVDRVARSLAVRLAGLGVGDGDGDGGGAEELFRRRAAITATGDLVKMLRLPAARAGGMAESVEVDVVLTPEGDLWKPSSMRQPASGGARAEVILLGDSFSNVFSDPALGWGGGAGLAEQLAFHLGAGVERIAINDGGAEAATAAMWDLAGSRRDYLEGRKAVILQFAARELSLGDWRLRRPARGDL